MLRGLLSGALRFRVLLIGLAVALIAAGAVSLPSMHNEVLPELANGPVLEVQTEAPGLSSTEVEQYVTVPLENNLLDGVMGVWDVRSDSIPGLAKVDLYFEPGTTQFHARQLVEERLTNAFSLPNVAKPPLLIQPLSTSSRALLIGLNSHTVNPLELSYLARWIVKPRLSGVQGVANVAIFGQQDRQIQVQVQPAELGRHGVTLQDIIDTAGNSQLVSPLSYLEGSAPGTGGFLDGPNQRLDIRPVLPLGTPQDLATVPIAGRPAQAVSRSGGKHRRGPSAADRQRSDWRQLRTCARGPDAAGVKPDWGHERCRARSLRPSPRARRSKDRHLVLQAGDLSAGRFAQPGARRDHCGARSSSSRSRLCCSRSERCSLPRCRSRSRLRARCSLLQLLGQTLNALLVLGLLVASAVLVDDAVGGAHELSRAARNSPARAAKYAKPNGKRPMRATVGQTSFRGCAGRSATPR